MFKVFHGITADAVWQEIAAAFRDDSMVVEQASRAGHTREIMHVAISIVEPRQRWVVSRHPAINPAFAIAEVVWILTGRNDAAFLNYFNRQLPTYAGTGRIYDGAYGHRLRQHFGIDQLDRAYSVLCERPDSRQVVLQMWDGQVDLPGVDGRESSPDIPCNVVSLLKVRNGALEWTQVLRSNDVFRGQPYNFVQFTALQEVIAGWLGLDLGGYHQISDSLHVYEKCRRYIDASCPIEVAENTDRLALPKEESDTAFAELGHWVENIADPTVTAEELVSRADKSALPGAFKNMLCVLIGEGARRRGQHELGTSIMDTCTNAAYRQLWDRWCARMRKRQEDLAE
jgi:thymidylate synthase